MSVLSAFNSVIMNLLDDCILIFKDDKDFKVYKRGLGVVVKYNPKQVHTVFKEYLDQYRVNHRKGSYSYKLTRTSYTRIIFSPLISSLDEILI